MKSKPTKRKIIQLELPNKFTGRKFCRAIIEAIDKDLGANYSQYVKNETMQDLTTFIGLVVQRHEIRGAIVSSHIFFDPSDEESIEDVNEFGRVLDALHVATGLGFSLKVYRSSTIGQNIETLAAALAKQGKEMKFYTLGSFYLPPLFETSGLSLTQEDRQEWEDVEGQE